MVNTLSATAGDFRLVVFRLIHPTFLLTIDVIMVVLQLFFLTAFKSRVEEGNYRLFQDNVPGVILLVLFVDIILRLANELSNVLIMLVGSEGSISDFPLLFRT